MKALVQDAYGGPEVLRLQDLDPPVPKDGEVLVRVRAASVNALDWRVMRGEPLPLRLAEGLRGPTTRVRGVDVAGIVEAVGKDVASLKPGDEVFGTATGSFAELALAPEDRLAPKPRGATFAQAAAIPVAGLTALQGLRDRAKVQPGQRVLVYGAGGGVGTFAVQVAKAFGARVTAATRARSVELVRSLGADEVLDHAAEDVRHRGARYDVFFDVGGTLPLADCRSLLALGGALVLAGAPAGPWTPITRLVHAVATGPFAGSRTVVYVSQSGAEDLVALKELVEAGKVTPVIDRAYPLQEAAEAIRYVEEGRARGKVVVKID
jgi:NADPH:quinone reductase-like Zn-dependent oxidoreductase